MRIAPPVLLLIGLVALIDAQAFTTCVDTRSTRKCLRKINRKGWQKCDRPGFQSRCQRTCNRQLS